VPYIPFYHDLSFTVAHHGKAGHSKAWRRVAFSILRCRSPCERRCLPSELVVRLPRRRSKGKPPKGRLCCVVVSWLRLLTLPCGTSVVKWVGSQFASIIALLWVSRKTYHGSVGSKVITTYSCLQVRLRFFRSDWATLPHWFIFSLSILKIGIWIFSRRLISSKLLIRFIRNYTIPTRLLSINSFIPKDLWRLGYFEINPGKYPALFTFKVYHTTLLCRGVNVCKLIQCECRSYLQNCIQVQIRFGKQNGHFWSLERDSNLLSCAVIYCCIQLLGFRH